MSDLRPTFAIAEEIGQRVIDAADKLQQFTPDLTASFTFELDDTEFSLTVQMRRSS